MEEKESNLMEHVEKLEKFLQQIDCFSQSGNVQNDQQKLRLHRELHNAWAIYHNNLVMIPNIPEAKRIEDLASDKSNKALQECKRDQLNQVFSRLFIESQKMQEHKETIELKLEEIAKENENVIKQQKEVEEKLLASRQDLKDKAAANEMLGDGNKALEINILQTRDKWQIKFLELLCIVENSIVELEKFKDKES